MNAEMRSLGKGLKPFFQAWTVSSFTLFPVVVGVRLSLNGLNGPLHHDSVRG